MNNNNYNQTNINSFNQVKSKRKQINLDFNKGQKTVIISLLCIVIILLTTIIVSPYSNNGNSRTVMIYVVGSNLETDAGIVTAELEAINPKMIDLKNTNILLYTGGTEKWHNFISNEDNGLYILKSNGFEKIESQEQLNMGAPSTLTQFLKYGYEKYKADKYELILYNHGGAIDGAIYDDITGDNLSLEDMQEALKNSPFNQENKLETVTFRTCLNGTIELANVFKDYANYLIGSEEISYGSNYTDVLGFLNNVEIDDTGLEYGIKFVEAYEEQMNILNPLDTIVQTYSVIDLSKISKLNKELDEYISSINLTKHYNEISKIRANMHQYGIDAPSYDMIDLYDFIVQTEKFASKDSENILNLINETVVYNKTNEPKSHGISIYFPYAGTQSIKNRFLFVYEILNYSEEYKNFIKTFNSIQKKPSSFKFDLSANKVELNNNYNEVSIQLTKEQINNYVGATFTILERDKEHPNYYKPIYNTNMVTLDNKGILKADFTNQLIQINNEGKYEYILTYNRNNIRRTYGILYDKDLDFSDDKFMNSADVYFDKNKNGEPILSNAKLISDNERIDGILLNLNDYETIELWQHSYKILDKKGKVLDSTKWEGAPVVNGYSEELKKLELRYSSLEKGDNYYALFMITDTHGNVTTSKLIKVGD